MPEYRTPLKDCRRMNSRLKHNLPKWKQLPYPEEDPHWKQALEPSRHYTARVVIGWISFHENYQPKPFDQFNFTHWRFC